MAEYSKRQPARAQNADDHTTGEATSRKPRRAAEGDSIGSMVMEHAKSLVGEQVSRRTGRPAADLGKLAKALSLTSQQLEDNLAAPYIEKAATQIERFSEFLENAKSEEALRAVENFARKQPLLFLGGAALLGFGGARFIKSSAERRAAVSREAASEARPSGRDRSTPNARESAAVRRS